MLDITKYGELYHDYSIFGAKSIQKDGIFYANQAAKMPIITAYLQYAIAKSKRVINDKVSCVELFCADGFYAMLSRHLGATSSCGIDDNSQGFFDNALAVAKDLHIDDIDFITDDVNNINNYQKFDIVLNVGGLYHVSNPIEILLKSYHMANKYLVVQTVVSLANDDELYFESPAPEWTWGNRFNRKSFDRIINSLGFNVVDQHFNELEGNDRLEDRGSVYYLISKEMI